VGSAQGWPLHRLRLPSAPSPAAPGGSVPDPISEKTKNQRDISFDEGQRPSHGPRCVTSMIAAVSTRPNRENKSRCSRMSVPLVQNPNPPGRILGPNRGRCVNCLALTIIIIFDGNNKGAISAHRGLPSAALDSRRAPRPGGPFARFAEPVFETTRVRRMLRRFFAAVATRREGHRSPNFHPVFEESWLRHTTTRRGALAAS
jgi:hypothetical protein